MNEVPVGRVHHFIFGNQRTSGGKAFERADVPVQLSNETGRPVLWICSSISLVFRFRSVTDLMSSERFIMRAPLPTSNIALNLASDHGLYNIWIFAGLVASSPDATR